MDISDVSTLSLGIRQEHYRSSYGAYDNHPNSPERVSICQLADNEARDEMIQEIHTMLLHLCGKSDEN